MSEHVLKRSDGSYISYEKINGDKKLFIVYMHGLKSSNKSKKSEIVKEFALQNGLCYLSLDYTGHGSSWGTPEDFRVGRCMHDTLDVFKEAIGDTPIILVGSSLGGWVSFLVAEKLKNQIKSVIALAPGVDFLDDVWNNYLNDDVRTFLKNGGTLTPKETGAHFFNYPMFQDGQKYRMLNRKILYDGPVDILQGDKDDQVPMEKAFKIKDALKTTEVAIHILKGHGHSLYDGEAKQQLIQSMEKMTKKGLA